MFTPVSITMFVLGTLGLIALSWRCFRHPTSHGFPRFFVFESILCLFALNYRSWFRHPAAPAQLLSWALLVASSVFAVVAFWAFRRRGQPTAPDPRSPLFTIENTSSLVTVGLYKYVRHPMYASLLFLAWGVALKALSVPVVAITSVATALLIATAVVEERENLSRFGPEYRSYMARTHRFIPFLF